jgi:hypothetical protein
MADEISLEQTYDPNRLLDHLLQGLCVKDDVALARVLGIAPVVISKIRNKHLPVNASLLTRMHEASNLSINDLRRLMGDRRDRYRLSTAQRRPEQQTKVAALSMASAC